jgi:hypothetical protein
LIKFEGVAASVIIPPWMQRFGLQRFKPQRAKTRSNLDPMAATLSTISFDDVTLGASVRFTTIEGKQYLSVRDLIMCLCEMDNNDAGHTWRRLSAELKQGINEFLATFQFPGRGQSSQPVITFPGTIPLNFHRCPNLAGS